MEEVLQREETTITRSTNITDAAINDLTKVSASGLDYQTMQNLINRYREIIDTKVQAVNSLQNDNIELQRKIVDLEETIRMNRLQIEALQRVLGSEIEVKKEMSVVETITEDDISLKEIL